MHRAVVLLLATALLVGCSPLQGRSEAAPTEGVTPQPTNAPAFEVRPSEEWIEVDLAPQVVRLRRGLEVLAEYPASSGVSDPPEAATPPGVYNVQQTIAGPIENVPGVFVSDILIFDLAGGRGIHSRPMDKDGKILDMTLGVPSSGGCVRVGESAAVFAFAHLGTRVWIH